MLNLNPDDFGGLYHAIWDELLEGDFRASQSLIKSVQRLAESELETERLAAQTVLQQLAEDFHLRVRTQELDVFENLERHQFEELFVLVKPG